MSSYIESSILQYVEKTKNGGPTNHVKAASTSLVRQTELDSRGLTSVKDYCVLGLTIGSTKYRFRDSGHT